MDKAQEIPLPMHAEKMGRPAVPEDFFDGETIFACVFS